MTEPIVFSFSQLSYICTRYDNRKNTGIAVPAGRDKEVSLTLKTASSKSKKKNNFH
jgi:hypothetical protein